MSSGGGNFLHIAILCLCLLKGSLIPQNNLISVVHPVLAFPIKDVESDARIALVFLLLQMKSTAYFGYIMNS